MVRLSEVATLLGAAVLPRFLVGGALGAQPEGLKGS